MITLKKLLISSVIILLIFHSLTLAVFSARFRDDMDKLDSSAAISYYNLALSEKTGIGNDSLFKIKDIAQNGGNVVYRITNASKVSAVIYSAAGTQLYNDSKNNFSLGDRLSQSQLSPVNLSLFYSPSGKEVYILPDGSPQRLCYRNSYGYYFSSTHIIPNDLVNYTVNIYVSTDGNEYSSLPLLRTSSQFVDDMDMVREEWSAFIPSGVTYLKVALNDFTQVFTQPHGTYEPRSVENMTTLAYVDIEGSGLIIGVPQPLEVSTGWPSSSSKDKTESSKVSSSKVSSASKTSSADSSATSSSASPSTSTKFEGIVPPENSPKKTSSLAVSSKFSGSLPSSKVATSESIAKESALPSNESGEIKSETYFFAASDTVATENSSTFILGYVLILTVGILIALKNRQGSGK